MNIHELDSYDLGDAVKFNDKLNPRIWGADERMRPEVREQLLRIADDFREFLGIDVEVKDITVSGSNAAYTYTPHSDIDLHLVVDLPEADRNQVYRELFDAKKYAYNDQHDIRIGGYDVELYVQDANKKHVSQGIYSIKNDDWVSVPKRRRPEIDDISVKSKFEDLGHRIEAAIKSQDYERISDLATKIKDYRQAGLDAHGEFGPENLAFKMLRTQGLIQKLYDARNAAKDRLLSLDERKKKKKRKSVKYGYGAYWYPGYAYAGQDHPAGTEGGDGGGDGGGESMREDAGMTWDGVNPTTDMFTSEDATMTWDGVNPSTAMFTTETENKTDEQILRDFIEFCVKELKIKDLPTIKLRRDPEWPKIHKTFGRYRDDLKTLEVAWGNRHIMDVLRTVAHELTHKRQHEREDVPASAGETGSEYENEANARAGILMRDWARLYPEHFAAGQAEDLYIDESAGTVARATTVIACLLAGGNLSGCATAPQQNTQQILKTTQDVGRAVQTAQKITRAGAEAEVQKEIRNFTRVLGGRTEEANTSNIIRIWKRLQGPPPVPPESQAPEYGPSAPVKRSMRNEGASGYIPTRAQARDPRYSMALTVDIKPGQVGKEANKLKLKTDRQGHPQIARANGLFENLYKEYRKFKAAEDYSPDQPPGPEFRPTMPAGTLRVDVSDVYDWYKLGQHISNMKGLGQHDFGKGPPSTIISFGDEDTEHKFIKDLEATGLNVTDIDPASAKKPAGRKIKTDPTYNVDEAIQAPVNKSQDAEQYYRFIMIKAQQNKPLTRAEQEYKKMYELYRQQKLAEDEDKMSQINLDQKLARTPAVWQRFVKGLPPQLAQEFVDERPQPDQEDIAYFTPLSLTSHEPVYVKTADLLRHPENQGNISRSPDDVIDAVNQRWDTKIASGKKYDANPGRYRKYSQMRAPMASPSVMVDGVIVLGVGRFVAAALRGDDRMRVWSMTRKQAVKEDEDLDEVKMSPGALEKFATSDAAKGIRAGFEAELIFRDTQGESDELDPEPNYDADERCYSIQQVIDFFSNDEYGYGLSDRAQNRLMDDLDERYMEWRDEQIISDFRNDAEDLIRDILLAETPMDQRIHFYLTDSLQMSDEEADAVIKAGADAPRFTNSDAQKDYADENPEYKTYLEASDEAEQELEESVEFSVNRQDEYWDEALDKYRDDYSGDDDSFFSDVGLRWMSDVANEYNLDWPVWDGGQQQNYGSRGWEDIGNSLQDVVDMPVVVSSNYHTTKRRPGQWIIEPDGSLDPDDKTEEAGLEIVSPPMPLLTAIEKLKAVTDWANDPNGGNAYTNSSTGLHMGVSLPTMKSEGRDDDIGIDYVKLILFLGDKYVQQQFGREANTYCASALDKLKQNIKGKKSDPAGVVELLRHGLTELAQRELQKGVGTSKYTSAHIQPGYIEFRSPGGDWLAKADEEIGVLENTMLRFARAMAIAGDPSAERQEYAKKLYKLVTTDNPEYADQLKLFSEFSAGTINKEQLKKQWADTVLQKELPSVGKQEYEVYRRDNGDSPDATVGTLYAKDYDDAYDQFLRQYGRDINDLDVRIKQPWFDVFDETGRIVKTLRAKDIDKATERAQYEFGQEWTDAWNIYRRPDDTPEPKASPRAQVAKRIAQPKKLDYNYEVVDRKTGKAVDRFYSASDAEADKTYARWLELKRLPQDTEDYGYRRTPQASDARRDSADLQRNLGVQDVEPNIAQNFEPDYSAYERNSERIAAIQAQAQQPGNWDIYQSDDPSRVVNTLIDATERQVQDWLRRQETQGMPPGFLSARRQTTTESWRSSIGQAISRLEENFADKKVSGKSRPGRVKRAGASCKGSVTDLRARAKKYSGEKGRMYHWCANMKSGRKK